MANTVIALKKSATPTAAPVSLANGEIAINYADGIIYYKAANGSIASISSGTASFGTVNAAGTLILADMVNDVLDIRSGNNIEISGDAINDRITITANLAPAFDRANSANVLAFNTGIGANAWANSIGTAGNNYTNQVGAASNTWANNVGTAGNNYTNQVGAAANTWANTLSTTDRAIANSAANSSNAYIITVGAASNTWANTIATAGNNYISSTIYPAINAARVNVSSTAPASPSQGSLWWHKDYGRLFVYYTDEDATSQWVDSTIGIGNPVITDDFVSGNTNNTFYLTFIANTSGTMQTAFVSSGKLTFNSNTGILSATEFNSLSDLNRKTNIAPIQDAIDKITKLDGVTFNWKDNGKPSAGIIAQQLQEVMPELVSSDMSVNYSGIIGLLVECIKELNNKLPK